LKNKTVLLRVNFDVPIKNGKVVDDSRILAHLPTINFILKAGAKLILISHLGRPNGIDKKYSLEPVYLYLKKKFKDLEFLKDKFDFELRNKIRDKKFILLENLRFDPGEEKNDNNFAKFLASLADIYVDDAFPVCHRAHASVSAITKYVPSYAGLLLAKEIKNLSEVLTQPQKPFIVLMGGAKISTKLPVLKTLTQKADKILIGGALANDLLKADGYEVSKSLVEDRIIKMGASTKEKIILPTDLKIKTEQGVKNVLKEDLSQYKNFNILDIGLKTIEIFAKYLRSAKMIVWNGPMGLFEEKSFEQGTRELVKSIVSNKKAKIVFGGGETLASLKLLGSNYKLPNNVFVSTGGGAMLEFLSGKILPGIKPLIINHK
jgi:3-phosphoglycerate kinase